MDRFDMMISVSRIDPGEVMQSGGGISSAALREGVIAARVFADNRRNEEEAALRNGAESSTQLGRDARIVRECRLELSTRAHMENLARRRSMSGRGVMKTLAVARTIADLRQSDRVEKDDIDEAIMYRGQDS